MKTQVHILATVRNAALLPAARLVFQTLRIGFPTAEVIVWGNGLDKESAKVIQEDARRVKATFRNDAKIAHGRWIEALCTLRTMPFWICDTDMVFFDEVEQWFSGRDDTVFAGRYEPDFRDEWTGSLHVARLHPSLMWFNPQRLHIAMRRWPGQHAFFDTVDSNLFRWQWIPRRVEVTGVVDQRSAQQELWFYDTCAGLHQALGGTLFTEEQNEAYEHLFCGTYSDLIAPIINGPMREMHDAVCKNPSLAKGLWKMQREYFKQRALYNWQKIDPQYLPQTIKGKNGTALWEHRSHFPFVLGALGLEGLGVEIGVQYGLFAAEILKHWPGELLCVDSWKHIPGQKDTANVSDEEHQRIYELAYKRLSNYGRVMLKRETSEEFLAKPHPHEWWDFVYLDADHSYEAVKEQLTRCIFLVKRGGVIAGHDYLDGEHANTQFGVKRAVDEWAAENDLTVLVTKDYPPSWLVVLPIVEPQRHEEHKVLKRRRHGVQRT